MPKEDFAAAASEHAHDGNYKIWEQNKYTDERMSSAFKDGVCQALSCIFLFMNYTRQTLVYDAAEGSDYGKTATKYLEKRSYMLKHKPPSTELSALRSRLFPKEIMAFHHTDGSATFREFLRWGESAILVSSLQSIENKKSKDLDTFGVGLGPNAKVEMILGELTKGHMVLDEGGSFPVDPGDDYAAFKKFNKWGYYLLQFSNHAMAVVVRDYESKYKFFDPNYGIVQFWDSGSLIAFSKEFLAAERPNEFFKILRLV